MKVEYLGLYNPSYDKPQAYCGLFFQSDGKTFRVVKQDVFHTYRLLYQLYNYDNFSGIWGTNHTVSRYYQRGNMAFIKDLEGFSDYESNSVSLLNVCKELFGADADFFKKLDTFKFTENIAATLMQSATDFAMMSIVPISYKDNTFSCYIAYAERYRAYNSANKSMFLVPWSVTIPDIKNMSFKEAKDAISTCCFIFETNVIENTSDDVVKNTVLVPYITKLNAVMTEYDTVFASEIAEIEKEKAEREAEQERLRLEEYERRREEIRRKQLERKAAEEERNRQIKAKREAFEAELKALNESFEEYLKEYPGAGYDFLSVLTLVYSSLQANDEVSKIAKAYIKNVLKFGETGYELLITDNMGILDSNNKAILANLESLANSCLFKYKENGKGSLKLRFCKDNPIEHYKSDVGNLNSKRCVDTNSRISYAMPTD